MTSEKHQPDRDKTGQVDETRESAIDDGGAPEPTETGEATAAQSVDGEEAACQPVEPALEETNEAEAAAAESAEEKEVREAAAEAAGDPEVEEATAARAEEKEDEEAERPEELEAAVHADAAEQNQPKEVEAVQAEAEEVEPAEAAAEEAEPVEVTPAEGETDSTAGAQSGAFEIQEVPISDKELNEKSTEESNQKSNEKLNEEFNIKPKDRPAPIPEEQSEIAHGIYETWGVLKLLREQGVFSGDNDQEVFREFRDRLVQVAQVGLAANNVKTRTAAKALEQIRQGIILRKGVAIKLRYLLQLAIWSLYGILAGLILIVLSGTGTIPATLAGYGWVLIGAMVGAWMSVASTRRALAFHEIAEYLSSTREPIVRLLFVGFLAMTLALMITYGVITLDMGKASLADFHDKRGVAVLIGLIAGIGEKAVSLRIIERVQKTVTTGTS